jgi:hypothetical protein
MLQQLGRVLRRLRRPGRQDVAHRGALSVRPRLELLEDRLAPAVFNVNSTADILAPPPGVVTLRSAIQAANATPGNNIINLTVAGTYKITIPGAGEDNNATGDFDIIPNPASPANSTLLIRNTSGGNVTVDGNKLDRVFDINPAGTSNPATKLLVTMEGFTITNGVASDPANPDGPTSTGGGIRDQGNADLTLTNMVITNNNATADGGGVVMENAVNSSWTLTINNSTISNNHSGDAGGGIDTDGAGTVVINPGTVITGNTDLNQGAGVYVDSIQVGSVFVGAPMTMTGTVVSNNQALAAGITASGGGISNAGNGTMTIVNSTIANNFSGGMGGGFSDENNVGTLVVRNSLFLNNSAIENGGGIQEGGPSTTISDSEFLGNSSGASGGGLFANGTTLTVTGSTFAGNRAVAGGGAIELETTGTGASASAITNATLAGNSALNNAGANGGGIEAPGAFAGTVTLLNATINGNFASSGGGVFWAGAGTSKFAVQNTILAANAASTGPDADNPAGTFTDNGGNLIGVSGTGSGNSGFTAATTQSGTTANPLNPLLAGLAYNGGPIVGSAGNSQGLLTEATLTGSPARDKGVATGLTVDERGFRRPDDAEALPDVGAFEFQGVTLAVSITPSASSVPLGSTVTFQVKVSNTSGNDLPDDASTVAVTLSAGLTPASPLTFTLGALPAGQSKTFSVTATATGLGTQTASVTVTSPDADPNTVSASVTVTGVPAAITPVGALTVYAFGFGPGFTLDFFEVDSVGHVFVQGFSFLGPVGPVQFLANSLRIPTGFAAVVNNTVAAFQAGDNGQLFLIDIFNPLAFFNPFVFNAVLAAFGL